LKHYAIHIRGSDPEFSSSFFFWREAKFFEALPEFSSSFFFWREAKFFEALGRTKKQTDCEQHKAFFFDNLIIALPDARHFDGNPQPRWEIRLKMGIVTACQHKVTDAFFCFFAALALLRKKHVFACIFINIVTISIKI
jgi:hypothetical protein